MLGTLTCALVRMFGGRHNYRRAYKHEQIAVKHYGQNAKVCRRCGFIHMVKPRQKLPTVAEVRELLRETKT